jgi:hypothetical protein
MINIQIATMLSVNYGWLEFPDNPLDDFCNVKKG